VSEQLLTILKLCLLALLYLFFLRVLRAVWVEIKPPAGAAGFVDAPKKKAKRKDRRPARPSGKRGGAPSLVVVEPSADKGRSYPLADELTVGRAAGCHVTVDDTYVSQMHSRVYQRNGQLMVEDLGSTNGTYLNGVKVTGPMVMQRGDKLKVGNTVLELG
jgi:hypothetical protein